MFLFIIFSTFETIFSLFFSTPLPMERVWRRQSTYLDIHPEKEREEEGTVPPPSSVSPLDREKKGKPGWVSHRKDDDDSPPPIADPLSLPSTTGIPRFVVGGYIIGRGNVPQRKDEEGGGANSVAFISSGR